MGIRDLVFVGVVLAGAGSLGSGLLPRLLDSPSKKKVKTDPDDIRSIVASVDRAMRPRSDRDRAPGASELAVLRRLSLALTGSIPSLEEIRRFESRPEGKRVDAWLAEILGDRRSADYLAERFARAFVGTEDGPFLKYRRRRFVGWVADAIFANRPYDALVRDLIADRGITTDRPATNFVSVAVDMETERPDPERLGARVARAFLGVRLDCAQCHDHPFQAWKQGDFRGLAAFFGGSRFDLRGVRDDGASYSPLDRKTHVAMPVEPRVPFRPELLPQKGTPRERLAGWVVDPKNASFARATTNRVWAILFGQPLSEPIDDLPAVADLPPALLLLADDFAAHKYNLRRLIRVIASTEAFRLDSLGDEPGESGDSSWGSFPMTRLRPEQVASSLFQTASLSTLDGREFWFFRFIAFNGQNDFIRRYGDAGEDEFQPRGATIPQGLLLMNGDLVFEKTKDEFGNAATRVALLAPDDRKAVEIAYLSVLTRYPSPEESAHFEERLRGTRDQPRKDRLSDLYWTLINATEFSWNH